MKNAVVKHSRSIPPPISSFGGRLAEMSTILRHDGDLIPGRGKERDADGSVFAESMAILSTVCFMKAQTLDDAALQILALYESVSCLNSAMDECLAEVYGEQKQKMRAALQSLLLFLKAEGKLDADTLNYYASIE
ncbi:MAG: hypothetical protein OXT65_00445 [Alphaproteobacteria bacterium]|nr:hypothetical protein [Alphaproteobacteria bacterium]